MGHGQSEGTITSWIKSVGDTVEEGDAIATVEAEKVEDEGRHRTGTLVETLVEADSSVPGGPQLPLSKMSGPGQADIGN